MCMLLECAGGRYAMDDASLSVATDVCVCVAGVAIEDACSLLVVRV